MDITLTYTTSQDQLRSVTVASHGQEDLTLPELIEMFEDAARAAGFIVPYHDQAEETPEPNIVRPCFEI